MSKVEYTDKVIMLVVVCFVVVVFILCTVINSQSKDIDKLKINDEILIMEIDRLETKKKVE